MLLDHLEDESEPEVEADTGPEVIVAPDNGMIDGTRDANNTPVKHVKITSIRIAGISFRYRQTTSIVYKL